MERMKVIWVLYAHFQSFAFTPQKAHRCIQRKGVRQGSGFNREKQRSSTELHF